MQKAKAILYLGICGVLVAGAAVLVLTEWGNRWQLHLYTRDVTVGRGFCLLAAAAAGVVLWTVCWRLFPAGVRALRLSQKADRKRKDAQAREEPTGAATSPPSGPRST